MPTTPTLRLHRDESPRDSFLFPGTTRGAWIPRLAGEGAFPDTDPIRTAEDALDRAERSMVNLKALIDADQSADRPRAA